MLSEQDVVLRLRAAGCVFAEDEAAMLVGAATSDDELEDMVARREDGFPIEHIVGWAEFCGLRIAVTPGVFVPRARSELLISQALQVTPPDAVVLDMCCGAGALGLVVASRVPGVQLFAVDVDEAAAACAARNIGSRGQVFVGDLYGPLPRSLQDHVDVLLVNAPYVPSDEIAFMPAEARLHEATVALDGGPDGLDVQRRVVAESPQWLASGGHVLIETSERQAALTEALLIEAGLATCVVQDDDRSATVVMGSFP